MLKFQASWSQKLSTWECEVNCIQCWTGMWIKPAMLVKLPFWKCWKNELLHQWFDKLFLWAFISIVECGTIKKSHFLTKFVFGLSIRSEREDFAKKRESKEETKWSRNLNQFTAVLWAQSAKYNEKVRIEASDKLGNRSACIYSDCVNTQRWYYGGTG